MGNNNHKTKNNDIVIDLLPEIGNSSENKVWDKFLDIVNSEKKELEFPRRAVMLDPDLHRSCKELYIIPSRRDGNINELVNSIVRAFLETYYEKLKPFHRQIDAKSIFETQL